MNAGCLTRLADWRTFIRAREASGMRRVLIMLLVVTGIALSPVDLSACGDKYLRLAARLGPSYRAAHRANVLIFMPQGSVVPKVARALGLRQTLGRAGHRVDAVESESELQKALRVRRYDIVIADAATTTALAASLQESPGSPTVVPAFHEQQRFADAEMKRARCLNSSHRRAYVAAAEIDHVMELRTRSAVTIP